MKTIWLRVFAWVQRKPLFVVLLLGIAVISLPSLKPQMALLGWDNYSSYFRPDINMFRLFFATWREFRGLGVASDAEVAEIGRLMFYAISRLFVGENLLDQLHHIFAFTVGSIMMYKLADYVIRTYDVDKIFSRHYDFFAFMAAFFYIFNLNSMSVFYFPMPMFVIRFYALPLLFYVFLKLLYDKRFDWWKKAIYGILIFMSTGSYIVPTVFITVCMTLGFLIVTQKRTFKILLIIIFFIGFNVYWLAPFANYTIQKGKIVQRAPTFVAINESQLNKDSSYFAPLRQLTFYPQFFEMFFKHSESNKVRYFHPLAESMNKYPTSFGVITFFPVLYLLGGVLMLVVPKNRKQWAWVPGILFTFIFLTLKDYSLLGILYGTLAKYVPFFEMIFRFGDTKFHPFIAFAGSIAAAYALIVLYDWGKKIMKKEFLSVGFMLLFIIPTLFLYKEVFTGNLIGFFMYNKIPDAYRALAEDINNEPGYGRVLHLPIEETTQYYWRPYSWGYFGSAFFHYMIDKPYIDRTFEPASMENAYIHNQITSLMTEVQSLPSADAERVRAQRLSLFLQNIGVKYLIVDDTISIQQQARGYDVWGNVSIPNAQKVANLLVKNNFAQEKKKYAISLEGYSDIYSGFPHVTSNIGDDTQHLTLYEINDVPDKIISLEEIRVMQSVPDDSLNRPQFESVKHYVEREFGSFVPFGRGDGTLTGDKSQVIYTIPLKGAVSGQYTLDFDETVQDQFLIELAMRENGGRYSVIVYKRLAPSVGETEFKMQLAEIEVPIDDDTDGISSLSLTYVNEWPDQSIQALSDTYRIRVGGVLFPVAIPQVGSEIYLGSFVTDQVDITVELLKKSSESALNLQTFKDIPNSGCYADALLQYSADLQLSTPTLLTAKTRNGSLCFWNEVKELLTEDATHIEFEMTLGGSSQDLDQLFQYGDKVRTTKPRLKAAVQSYPKPTLLNVCLRERSFERCLAGGKLFIDEENRFRFTATQDIQNLLDPMLFFGLRTFGYQQIEVVIRDASITLFEEESRTEVSIPTAPRISPFALEADGSLSLTFPRDLTSQSFHLDPTYESPMYFSDLCDRYQTMRNTEFGIINFVQGCESTLFVNLPFSTANMYLWSVDYALGSGQYPLMIMGDENQNYLVERASFLQGYPEIEGFHIFQDPETIFTSRQIVQNQLKDLQMQQAIQMIYPQTDFFSAKDRSYYFRQTTENEGLLKVSHMQVVRVPAYWSSLAIVPEDGDIMTYQKASGLTFSRILPSLWKVSYESSKSPVMLKFSEGYDRQWGVYGSMRDVLFGNSIAPSIRCDGYANCFEIFKEQQKGRDLYIFYIPERLALIGWIGTMSIVLAGIMLSIFVRRRSSSS